MSMLVLIMPFGETVPGFSEAEIEVTVLAEDVCLVLSFGVTIAQLAVLSLLCLCWNMVCGGLSCNSSSSGQGGRFYSFVNAKKLTNKLLSEGQLAIG